MTRLLYLPDDVTVIQLETEIPSGQLCAAVNAGMRPLTVLRSAPPGKLIARELGGTVVVAPAAAHEKKSSALTSNHLSRRQSQVLELYTRGFSSGEIALLLQLSRRTVNYHLHQARNRSQASA